MYTINYLEIFIIALIIIFTFLGFKKGFIQTTIDIASLFLSIFGAYIFAPILSNFIKTTDVYTNLIDMTRSSIHLENATQTITMQNQASVVHSLNLPSWLENFLINIDVDYYDVLNISTLEDYLAVIIANVILAIFSFIAVIILIRIFIYILRKVLGLFTDLPIIKTFNKLGGLIVGLIKGVCISWIILLLIPIIISLFDKPVLYDMITDSAILTYLYETNIFLNMLVSIFS